MFGANLAFLSKFHGIRTALLSFLLISLLASVSTAILQAQGGTPPDPDGADLELQTSLQKANFESDTLSPWKKGPASAPGTIVIEGCCANHTPNGYRNVSIQPAGQVITLKQKVSVASNTEYYLGAFVATESNAQTASLKYGSSVCGFTNVAYTSLSTNYPLLSCAFTTGATQANVVVKLNGSSTSQEIVSDDWSLKPTPKKTTSRYMGSVNTMTAYNLGCDAGNKRESGVVILSWGHPAYLAPNYGVLRYPGNVVFESTTNIASAAKQ